MNSRHGDGDMVGELGRLVPVPAGRDLPASRRNTLKEHLMSEFRTRADVGAGAGAGAGAGGPGRRPRRTILAAVAGAVAGAGALAAAATAITVGLTAASPPAVSHPAGSHPAGSAASGSAGTSAAAELLAKIARAAGSQPSPAVGDNQFEYIQSVVAFETDTITNGHETSALAQPHERQIWLPVSDLCRTGLLIESGSKIPLSSKPADVKAGPSTPQSIVRCPWEGTLNSPSYRLLKSLPTDPRTLLNLIYAQTKGSGPSPDAEAFTTIGDLISESIVPPQVAAALYRAAALIPGVTVQADATNALGKHGVAVAWTSTAQGHQSRAEWIFDRTTLQYMGERDYDVRTGAVQGESAIVARGFVDRPGQLPANG